MDDPLHDLRRRNQLVLYGLADPPLSGHPAEHDLTQLAATAKDLLRVDYAGVHIVTDEVQATLAASDHADVDPIPRRLSICAVTLARDEGAELVEIADVAADAELRDLPLTPDDRPGIRFYAAAPLVGREGFALGMLCVVADRPRRLTSAERRTLTYLGYAAEHILDRHRRRRPLLDDVSGRAS